MTTAGEVSFAGTDYADKPGFQARAERKVCAFQTSPAVAHEPALITAYENKRAIFRRVSKVPMTQEVLASFAAWKMVIPPDQARPSAQPLTNPA
jgi:hypothetical protein